MVLKISVQSFFSFKDSLSWHEQRFSLFIFCSRTHTKKILKKNLQFPDCVMYVCNDVWEKHSAGRCSRPEVFCKKGVYKSFARLTGKHLCQNLFLNKIAGLGPATLLKKRLWHNCFLVSFAKFLTTPFGT